MYGLAACDNTGKCVGFLCEKLDGTKFVLQDLTKIRVLEQSKDYKTTEYELIKFKKKSETNEMVLQNNLGSLLLPNGNPFRYVAIKL